MQLLTTFSSVAPEVKGRGKGIGWNPRQQATRLGLVRNNSCFLLMLERERHPNLVSKIHGLMPVVGSPATGASAEAMKYLW